MIKPIAASSIRCDVTSGVPEKAGAIQSGFCSLLLLLNTCE